MNNTVQEVLRNAIPGFCGPNGGGVLTGDPARPIQCNPGELTIDRAYSVALWLETLLFGLFVGLYVVCLWILFRRHRPFNAVACALLGTSTAMFALSLTHVSISLFRHLQSLSGDDSPLLYIDFSNPWFLSKTVLYFLQTILSDTFLVYRCWVVWGRNWKVAAIPLFLILVHAVVGFVLVRELGMPRSPSSTEFDNEYLGLFSTYLALTLVANGSATALIGYRVWRAQVTVAGIKQEIFPIRGPNLNRVMAVLLESGTAYSLALIALLATYTTKSNAHFIVLDCMTPFIGIVFTAIMIRVAMGRSSGDTSKPQWNAPGKASRRSCGPVSFGSSSATDGLSDRSIYVGLEIEPVVEFPQRGIIEGRV